MVTLLNGSVDLRVFFIESPDGEAGHVRIHAGNLHLGTHPLLHALEQARPAVASVPGQVFDGNLGAFVPEEQVQLLFIMEVMEQQRLADARVPGYLAHGAVLIGILRKHPVSGIDDSLLLFFRQGKEPLVHPVTSVDRPVNYRIYPLTDFEKTSLSKTFPGSSCCQVYGFCCLSRWQAAIMSFMD